MLSAKLIKALEKKGFLIEFPEYNSNEELIIEILKENNPRINLNLTIFLNEGFDYRRIKSLIDKIKLKELNKIIIISEKIYRKENIRNNLKDLIIKNKIRSKHDEKEFDEFYNAFKDSLLNMVDIEQKIIEKQSKLRLNLDLNKNLRVLFSPAKIRIMKKIFNHEKLTNTELKYYYRSISNINKAVLTHSLQDYLRIIEISKKFMVKSL